MDIGWSIILQHKILKENERKQYFCKKKRLSLSDPLLNLYNPIDDRVEKTCERCGQNPYFCQCSIIQEKIKSAMRKK